MLLIMMDLHQKLSDKGIDSTIIAMHNRFNAYGHGQVTLLPVNTKTDIAQYCQAKIGENVACLCTKISTLAILLWFTTTVEVSVHTSS